jgi:hypothetical protein
VLQKVGEIAVRGGRYPPRSRNVGFDATPPGGSPSQKTFQRLCPSPLLRHPVALALVAERAGSDEIGRHGQAAPAVGLDVIQFRRRPAAIPAGVPVALHNLPTQLGRGVTLEHRKIEERLHCSAIVGEGSAESETGIYLSGSQWILVFLVHRQCPLDTQIAGTTSPRGEKNGSFPL